MLMNDNSRAPDAWDPDDRESPTADDAGREPEHPETAADGQPERDSVEIDADEQLQGYETDEEDHGADTQ